MTRTFDSQDQSHCALDEWLYLLPSGWDDLEWPLNEWKLRKINQGQSIATQRDLISILWWGNEAVMGGEAGGLCQCFHKTIFYAHWNNPTTTTKKPRTALSPLPTSDKNQIITGVTYALSAWYFNLAFQLIRTMIKASIICSLWRPVEQ